MKSTVQILAPSVRRSFKEGSYISHECQCVVLGDDVHVGVLKISERAAVDVIVDVVVPGIDKDGKPMVGADGKAVMVTSKAIPAGAYELEYGLGISWDKKELGGVLKTIVPVGKGNAALAALSQVKPESDRQK